MDEITVFISYSHDSDEHREKVLALSERLRADGINTRLDQYLNGSPQQGWPRWMLDQLDAADFVLVVCTETYYRRFRGHEVPGKGKGVDWEGALITQEMYDSRRQTLKFIPVFLSPGNEAWIPEPLRAVTHYTVNSEAAYQSLYDFLLGQAGVEPRPLGELKKRTRRQGEVLTFEQRTTPNQDSELIRPTEFVDDRVKEAAVILDRARMENSLTIELLVRTLDRLFNRATFRDEPSIGLCVTQEWDYRLHAAVQTLRLFQEYDQFVETEGPRLLELYRELSANISRYCDRMAAYLFDPPVGLRELRRAIGTDEFVKTINSKRKLFVEGADPATCARIDPFLKNAIDEMKNLRDEVPSVKESGGATSQKFSQVDGNERFSQTPSFTPSYGDREDQPQSKISSTHGPRVYISYSWRTKGLKQRALKLAEKLWAARIDTRIDLFYAKSLHGFAPPDPLPDRDCWDAWQEEQIGNADFVLLICTKEYFESPSSAGAWRDMNFMQQVLRSDETKRRKFIPVGFATHQAVEPFIPQFIRGANYYNLATTAQTGFGFTDLVRRLKTEFDAADIQSTQSLQNDSPSVRPSNGGKVFMNSRTITWLHLSDLHNCKEKTGWDAHRVLKPLVTDLKTMEKDHGLLPQMIFFTGDAVFGNIGDLKGSTMKEQFDGAHELLEQVRRTFSVEIAKDKIFIVPGNHDVDRAEVTLDQTSWLKAQTQAQVVNDLLHKAGKQWQRYMDRLKIYQESLARHGYDHLLNDPTRLIYAQTRNLQGVEVGIAGFNSAWACGGDGEKGHLWFGGDWQSGELTEKLSGADFRLALMHHPFGWFVEAEDAPLKILFEREFAFHLHGHEHLGWVDAKADGHVRVAAAACYDRSNIENGYNFVRLNLETGEGEVWLRRYDSQGGGWVPRVVARKTNNDGVWRLDKLPWLGPLVAKSKPNP